MWHSHNKVLHTWLIISKYTKLPLHTEAGIIRVCEQRVFLYNLWCLLNGCSNRNSLGFHRSSLALTPSCSFPASAHLCFGHGMMETACAGGFSDWLHHVFCWQTSLCAAAMREGECRARVCVQVLVEKKTIKSTASGQLTGWLLESFGRVDDHMQKAVQARSLLIWKTSTQSS